MEGKGIVYINNRELEYSYVSGTELLVTFDSNDISLYANLAHWFNSAFDSVTGKTKPKISYIRNLKYKENNKVGEFFGCMVIELSRKGFLLLIFDSK